MCLEQYPEHSRTVIQSWIAQGKVAINGRIILKAGTPVATSATVQINAEVPKFVSRSVMDFVQMLIPFLKTERSPPDALGCLQHNYSYGWTHPGSLQENDLHAC